MFALGHEVCGMPAQVLYFPFDHAFAFKRTKQVSIGINPQSFNNIAQLVTLAKRYLNQLYPLQGTS